MDKLILANGSTSTNRNISIEEVSEYKITLRDNFAWFSEDDHVAIADPYEHEVHGETCIRTCFPAPVLADMVGKEYASAHRMFLPNSQRSYVFGITLFADEQPSWITEEAFVIAQFDKYEEHGRACPNLEFSELMFTATDAFAESLGIDISNNTEDTLYTALIKNGEIVATRSYTNPTGEDPLISNWQGVYVFFCKKARRIDLARELFRRGL